jgi:hypothetical protein
VHAVAFSDDRKGMARPEIHAEVLGQVWVGVVVYETNGSQQTCLLDLHDLLASGGGAHLDLDSGPEDIVGQNTLCIPSGPTRIVVLVKDPEGMVGLGQFETQRYAAGTCVAIVHEEKTEQRQCDDSHQMEQVRDRLRAP